MAKKTAKKTMENYLAAWKKMDWVKMLKNSTKTFSEKNTKEFFKHWFEDSPLISYSIIEVQETHPGVLADTLVEVILSDNIKKSVVVRMIRETGAYRPSKSGVWGVNPQSSLKCLKPSEGDNYDFQKQV